jgi:hypothetical protein
MKWSVLKQKLAELSQIASQKAKLESHKGSVKDLNKAIEDENIVEIPEQLYVFFLMERKHLLANLDAMQKVIAAAKNHSSDEVGECCLKDYINSLDELYKFYTEVGLL